MARFLHSFGTSQLVEAEAPASKAGTCELPNSQPFPEASFILTHIDRGVLSAT